MRRIVYGLGRYFAVAYQARISLSKPLPDSSRNLAMSGRKSKGAQAFDLITRRLPGNLFGPMLSRWQAAPPMDLPRLAIPQVNLSPLPEPRHWIGYCGDANAQFVRSRGATAAAHEAGMIFANLATSETFRLSNGLCCFTAVDATLSAVSLEVLARMMRPG